MNYDVIRTFTTFTTLYMNGCSRGTLHCWYKKTRVLISEVKCSALIIPQ